jgi:GPI inositol-deacylase
MSFSESLNQCLKTSLPVLILALTFLSFSLGRSDHPSNSRSWLSKPWSGNDTTSSIINYAQNDLLLGSQDTFFWFLIPFFGIICTGICIAINYISLSLTHIFSIIYSFFYGQVGFVPVRPDEGR